MLGDKTVSGKTEIRSVGEETIGKRREDKKDNGEEDKRRVVGKE